MKHSCSILIANLPNGLFQLVRWKRSQTGHMHWRSSSPEKKERCARYTEEIEFKYYSYRTSCTQSLCHKPLEAKYLLKSPSSAFQKISSKKICKFFHNEVSFHESKNCCTRHRGDDRGRVFSFSTQKIARPNL